MHPYSLLYTFPHLLIRISREAENTILFRLLLIVGLLRSFPDISHIPLWENWGSYLAYLHLATCMAHRVAFAYKKTNRGRTRRGEYIIRVNKLSLVSPELKFLYDDYQPPSSVVPLYLIGRLNGRIKHLVPAPICFLIGAASRSCCCFDQFLCICV